MSNLKISAAVAALSVLAAGASSAMAGFTASTGGAFSYTAPGTALAPAVGGMISVTNVPLQTYTPDTAADPQIVAGDVGNFLFSLDLGVTSVDSTTGAVATSGTYSLFYDLGSNGTPDIRVSSGNAALYLTPAFAGFDVATGTLQQVLGPANPAFRDLAYGDNDNIVLDGGALGTLTNQFALTLRQNAVAPEPATLTALAGLGMIGLRRRRA